MVLKNLTKLAITGLIASIILLLFLNFLGPYNMLTALTASQIKDIPEIKEELAGYKILNIKYLGYDTYRIYTDKKDFIVVKKDSSDHLFWRYDIFEFKSEVEYFRNPM
ncbi:hypothetical protein HHO41_03675 [Bacillus sp. DNRA2]|uniref:hypothetical protein n=1 Tax=Bacillus sp. DNRA2 TaxID=2723053 RepID=UPI00145F42D5|nr:hypothetical protein [Bacillus sp. DNRA2]NMD69375.1 hypothetical protein [Bacillus sp. DNRA2]